MKIVKLFMRVLILSVSLIVSFVAGLSVSSRLASANQDASKVKQKAGETVEATKEYSIAKKQEVQADLQKKFDDLSKDIDDLKAKAQKNGESAKASVKTQLDTLEAKRKDVEAQLHKLSVSSGKAWDH